MCCIDWVLSIAIECELIRKATLSMQARIRSDDDVILLNQMIDPLTPPRNPVPYCFGPFIPRFTCSAGGFRIFYTTGQ